jgi:hypothetical protein
VPLILGVIGLFIALVTIGILRHRRQASALEMEAAQLAASIFSTSANAPSVELRWSYGWPACAIGMEAAHTAAIIFSTSANAPSVELRWSYGWPAFTLVFPTQEARSQSSDHFEIQEFSARLGELVVRSANKYANYDVNRALWVTSIPERQQLLASAKRH